MTRKLLAAITAGAGLCLIWSYVVIRAAKMSFTIDEAISYGIIHGELTFVDTTNNQWLNTLLMRVTQHAFGQSELALRLPNVAAFALYGIATIALLASLRHIFAQITAFALLVANPFLIEFFSVARGYGLSLALSAFAIALVFVGRSNRGRDRQALTRLVLLGVSASLAFYANFSALNVVLALLAVETVELFMTVAPPSIWLAHIYRAVTVAIIGLTVASLIPGILKLEHLQSVGQLYYGGHKDLLSDTLGSLLGASSCGYGCTPAWLTAGEIGVAAIMGLAVIGAAASYARARRWGNLHRSALLFTLAIAAVLTESWLLGTLYPIDRTALGYIPPFGMLVALAVDDTISWSLWRSLRLLIGAAAGALLTLTLVNFAQDVNLSRTSTWAFDASSRDVAADILAFERRHGRPLHPWRLIAGFPRNEALNYYRMRSKMDWLQPVTREPPSRSNGDLYYVGIGETTELPSATWLLASFPDTGTELRVAAQVYSRWRNRQTMHAPRSTE